MSGAKSNAARGASLADELLRAVAPPMSKRQAHDILEEVIGHLEASLEALAEEIANEEDT